MKENLLSITIGAIISLMMSFTGKEVLNGLIFSFIGGFMGLIGNTICKYFMQKLQVLFKTWFLKVKQFIRKKE